MRKINLSKVTRVVVCFAVIYFLMSIIISCRTEVVAEPVNIVAAKSPQVPLSWEIKPERKEWSTYIYGLIAGELFNTLDQAKDVERLCKKYKTLSFEQRVTVFSELISQMAYYESSWNQKSAAVDVGQADKKDTWSVGLMQISVTDQWGDLKLGYNYDDLLQPKPNLHLALKILERQVKSTGLVILPNSHKMRYWAVLLDGNKYSKVTQITAKTKALGFCQ